MGHAKQCAHPSLRVVGHQLPETSGQPSAKSKSQSPANPRPRPPPSRRWFGTPTPNSSAFSSDKPTTRPPPPLWLTQ